jgi:aspartate/methionine/tyrosine aminotransferase
MESLAHQALRKEHPLPGESISPPQPGFTHVGQTGVIYVTQRANNLGFHYGNKEWANFGQGAPETGALPNAPDKPTSVNMGPHEYEYAPVTGITPLRQKIADLYNKRYREGKKSQYTFENVAIVPGGRAGLMRLAVAIGDVNVGYFLPEYTAYEEMLTVFKHFVPIPTSRGPKEQYKVTPQDLEREILGRGLSVVALSNPCNPTGAVIEGEELKAWVDIARDTKCSLIMDEFYSHYIYSHPEDQHGKTVSCAAYIEDVNDDPVMLLDGLTKNWRLPGWRVCWIVAPKNVIVTIQSVGSFLEGGANHPLQVAAIPLVEYEYAQREAKAIQDSFRAKRDFVVKRLNEIGMKVHHPPNATFYAWADLSELPPGLDNGLAFFEEALKAKVILVPGIFFDINPGKRRELFSSPYHHFVRVSFGPSMDTLVQGLQALEFMIKNFKTI